MSRHEDSEIETQDRKLRGSRMRTSVEGMLARSNSKSESKRIRCRLGHIHKYICTVRSNQIRHVASQYLRQTNAHNIPGMSDMPP